MAYLASFIPTSSSFSSTIGSISSGVFVGKFFERQRDVIAHVTRAEQRRVLINHPDARADLLQFPPRQSGDVELLEENLTRRRFDDAENKAKDGALADAALSHDDKSLQRFDDEGDTVEHFFLFELQVHIAHIDNRWSRGAHGKMAM